MVAASAKVLWWVKSCMMCLRHSQKEAFVAGVGKGVIGGEVTGVLGIGQKLDHVGPLKKVLPVPHLYPLSTAHWCMQTLWHPTAPAALCLRAFSATGIQQGMSGNYYPWK